MPDESFSIPLNTGPADVVLYRLFSAAIEDGLKLVERTVDQAAYIGTHWDWPKLTWRKNGLPDLSDQGEAPKNYGMALRRAGRSDREIVEHPFSDGIAFQELLAYARSHPRIGSHLGTPDGEFITEFLENLVADVLDRYLHLQREFLFQPDKFLTVYLPIEKYLLEENLKGGALGTYSFPCL